jgi:hypothetical protein
MTEQTDPHLMYDLMDNDDPRLSVSKMDKLLAIKHLSITEHVDPSLKKLRSDNVLDKVNLSNSVSVYPRFTLLMTERVEPKRMAPRRDKEDPKSTKSITEIFDPIN